MRIHLLVTFVLLNGSIRATETSPGADARNPAAQRAHEEGVKWFRDAKFGVFVHWGLYSVPAGEWKDGKNYGEWFQIETRMPGSEYAKFAARFNPTQFDADRWIKNLKEDGIQYIVLTTKHHDGFAMYDTKLSDYNVVRATPWARDPMPAIAAACRKYGVKLCFYYSLPDWHSPDFPAELSQGKFHGHPNPNADLEKYVAYMKGQIREILTQYGPIGALWFDTGGAFEGHADYSKLIHAQEIVDEVHRLQPACMINDRLGIPGDYDTSEQRIPIGMPARLFETCMSLNNHWSYNRNDHDWKSPRTVIQNLATVASKGGNYLIGVGAVADGTFPPTEAQTILEKVGQWLKINGDSIYGTQASPLSHRPAWGCITQKDDKLYLHVFNAPKSNRLLVPIKNAVKKTYLLADPRRAPLGGSLSEHGTTIVLPEDRDPVDTVVVVQIADPSNIAEISQNLAKDKPVEVSSVWAGREDELNKSHIVDEQLDTVWAAEPAARSATVTVDLQAERQVSAAMLCDEPYHRTEAFDLEAKVGDSWKKVAEGTTIGEQMNLSFPPVKTRFIRLNIQKASDTPTLTEFQLFEE